MAQVVTMPKLGFDMAEGTLVRWVVGEGEQVTKGAVLAEIETDKATVEVESTYEGVVARHLVAEGTPVPVGEPIAVVAAQGEDVDVEKLLGEIAPEAETGLKPDAPVAEQEALPMESATEEAAPEKEAAPAREQAASAAGQERLSGDGKEKPSGDGQFPAGVRASPLALRMAEEKGVDLKDVQGTGPQGRIVKKDIEAFLEKAPAARPAPAEAIREAPQAAVAVPPTEKRPGVPPPAFTPLGPPPPDERIKLSRLRATIGRRMTESKQHVPHFYVTHEYNMGPLMAMRKQVNAMLDESEKLSVNDFIVKAVALALRQFPNLNAALEGDQVLRHGQVNIGNAVAIEGGLLTVTVRDADRKPLRQIAVELRTMAGRAREGKVRPDDIEGSTFSVSNMGMFDVEHFIAIINPPEAAILAVGSAMQVPVVENGEVKPGWRMKATLSVDHRVSDGAEGARFMQALAPYLEEPMRLFI
jgi:pyruvate dehydrogenase E2 component (dihydrolipoamide acetyltransferase)